MEEFLQLTKIVPKLRSSLMKSSTQIEINRPSYSLSENTQVAEIDNDLAIMRRTKFGKPWKMVRVPREVIFFGTYNSIYIKRNMRSRTHWKKQELVTTESDWSIKLTKYDKRKRVGYLCESEGLERKV